MTHNRSQNLPAVRGLVLSLSLLGLGACTGSGTDNTQGGTAQNKSLVAQDYYLQAQVVQLPAGTVGNTSPITMWGWAECTSAFASCGTASVPGPVLTAHEGETLNVHVRNNLTGAFVEPVSLVVPGQIAPMTPVWIDPDTGTVSGTGARPAGDFHSRVRSFTAETPPGNATETVYTWPSVKAGTYLYESGTHQAVQQQMGLYGALRVLPTAAGQAYADPTSTYDVEATLLFSEIDPALHDAIAAGTYGPHADPVPDGWMTSTVHYGPRYFLINGRPYSPSAAPIPGGTVGQRVLLRLLNAGLDTKVPVVLGPYLTVMAEDGNFITVTTAAGTVTPAPRQQYSVTLTAGKTMDAILTPLATGNIAVFDRRLNLSNAGASPGGLLTYLAVSALAADGGN